MVSVNSNLIVVAGITGTHIWRESLKRHIRCIFSCFYYSNKVNAKKISVSTVSHLKNTDGRQLAFNLNQEADIYFKQLKEAWQ
jgi:hypothetical protein